MYIHQHDDWPRFRWDADEVAARLGPLVRRRERLLGRIGALGLPLRAEAGVRALTQDAVSSSAIEGEHLNPAQVRSSLVRRLGLEAQLREPTVRASRQVEGVVAMLVDATGDAGAPLTAERLFGWHAGLFPAPGALRVGAWRLEPIQVVSSRLDRTVVYFEGPEPDRVPAEMQAFLEWIEAPDPGDGVIRAAIAHLWFVTIHPFDDGNGRVARAIADLALARAEGLSMRCYSMSAQLLARRKDYHQALERAQKGGLDITAWLLWFLDTFEGALDHVDTMLGVVLRKSRFWSVFAGAPLNPRQTRMLDALLEGQVEILTSSTWASMTQCSHDTALRDIQALVALGALVVGAAGGRSTRYTLVDPI